MDAPAVVIGAGVVGCAVAQALARRGRPPVVLERGRRVGEGVTSHNSGVVHAGLYYPPGSVKAQACVRGRVLVEEWCAKHGVPFRRCGKWIVGTREDEGEFVALVANARACGMEEIEPASIERLRSEVPIVAGEVALFSPRTGIVDAVALTQSLRAAAEELGATFVLEAEARAIDGNSGGWRVESTRGAVAAPLVVNAAGLFADEVARLAGIDAYRVHPCRGDYFRVAGLKLPTLVYPVRRCGAPGLGVHVTIDLEGNVRLGPDARFVEARDDLSPPADEAGLREEFHRAGSRLLRGLERERLAWDSCGLRPKLRSPGDTEERDFVVAMDRPGLVNLVGIESPGLTAALALAEEVVRISS